MPDIDDVLLDILVNLIEEVDEKKSNKQRADNGLEFAKQLASFGNDGKDMLKLALMDCGLDDELAEQQVKHIMNGQLGVVRDFVFAELIHKGVNSHTAASTADMLYSNLLLNWVKRFVKNNQGADLSKKYPKHMMDRLTSTQFALRNSRRIICPTCYRLIGQWDPTKNANEYGPPLVKCKQCNSIVKTPFTSWKDASLSKRLTSFVPTLIFLGIGLIGLIFVQDCTAMSVISIVVAIGASIRVLLEARHSMTFPTS